MRLRVQLYNERILRSRPSMLSFLNAGRCLSVSRLRSPPAILPHRPKVPLESRRSRFDISRGYKITDANQVNQKYMSTSANSSPFAAPLVSDQREEVELLTAVNDDHGGVIIEIKAPMDSLAFVASLRASILNWRKQEGFWYHHAEPSYLMLVYWIPATEHTLPVNATHRVGVGAFVMNDKREVLVVQEKSGKLRGLGLWKFPTGVVDQGEDIFAGVMREVKEETGIDTEFVEVLAFRQSHMSFFEKSDLFFVCMLRPLSFDIQKQESEIEAAQWMPIDEYAAQPIIQKHELLRYITDVGLAKVNDAYSGLSPVSIKSVFSDRESYLYLNSRDLNCQSRSDDVLKNI